MNGCVQLFTSRPNPEMVALAPIPRIVLLEPTLTMPEPEMVPWICTMRGVLSPTAATSAAKVLTSAVAPPAPPLVPLRPSLFKAAKPLTPAVLPGVPPLLELELEVELLDELVLELEVELELVLELEEPDPVAAYEQYRGVATLVAGNNEAVQVIGPVRVA